MAREKQNRRCCRSAHAARAKYKLKLVESLDKKFARIRRNMNEWNSEFQLEREIELLEHVLSGKIELQKKNAAKLSKENDELLNLRAELQKKYSNLLGFGETMNWESLIEDLQREILIRLPVKSFMRFKCVQRSWNILFKIPPFENKRRLHNSENPALEKRIVEVQKETAEVTKQQEKKVLEAKDEGNPKCDESFDK